MNVKLKVEQKEDKLLITEANTTVEETIFIIHTLIEGVAKHIGISAEEVYQDIGTVYDRWEQK